MSSPKVRGISRLPTGWIPFAGLFMLAFVAYLQILPYVPVDRPDSSGYYEVAQDLTDLSISKLHMRTPGYPLLLVMTGSSDGATRALLYAGLLLHLLAVWLLVMTLRSAGIGNSWLVVFTLVLLLPPFVQPAGIVMSENLTTLILTLTVAATTRWAAGGSLGWLITGALAAAYAGITRPNFQLLGIALALSFALLPFLRWSRIRWQTVRWFASAMVLASGALVGSTVMFNYLKFGYPGLTPNLGIAMTTKTSNVLERLPEEQATLREALITVRDEHLVKRGSSHTGHLYGMGIAPIASEITGIKDDGELSRYMLRLNLGLIARAPLHYIQEVTTAIATFWTPTTGDLAIMGKRWLSAIWSLVLGALFICFGLQLILHGGALPLILAGRFVRQASRSVPFDAIRVRTVAYLLSFTIVAYNMLTCCATATGDPRYRWPTEGLIVFLTFLGFHIAAGMLSRSSAGRKRLCTR